MREPRLIFGCDEEVAKWVAEQIPRLRGNVLSPGTAIGIALGERLIAGVVYHDYRKNCENIQISMASVSPLWARRSVITALLHYPFVQLNCWMVYTGTPVENAPAIKVNEHIGLKRKTIVPHFFGKKRHAVICQMTRTEYDRLYGVN